MKIIELNKAIKIIKRVFKEFKIVASESMLFLVKKYNENVYCIDGWSEDELMDIECFYKLMSNWKLENKILLITDESILHKESFVFSFKDFKTFALEYYPNKYQMDFMQPSDFIVYNESLQILILINHEGRYLIHKF